MRIAWFTPLSAGTGISRYSLSVVGALSRMADVEVWAPPCDDAIDFEDMSVRALGDPAVAAAQTSSCDLRVFHLGNHVGHLGPVYEVYRRAPGIVVLHDKVMQDFFYQGSSPTDYYRLMTYYYGQAGSDAALAALTDSSTLRDAAFAESFPLFEPCLSNAEAALTHSVGSADTVRQRYGSLVPVRSAQLPLSAGQRRDAGRGPVDRGALGVPEGCLLIVATGRVAPSKCIHVVLEAIATSQRLRDGALFVSVGEAEPDYLAELRALVGSLGLDTGVRFVTRADDSLLRTFLDAADICVNLRDPSTETGSATLVEQLEHAKPTVVYDAGIYGELPHGVVARVGVREGPDGVRRALLSLADDPDARAGMGARAAAYAAENCDPLKYAQELVELARLVVGRRPGLTAIDALAEDLGQPSSVAALRTAARAAAARVVAGGVS
jgi:glycosyltransferase involved in cell wall biosynthesis